MHADPQAFNCVFTNKVSLIGSHFFKNKIHMTTWDFAVVFTYAICLKCEIIIHTMLLISTKGKKMAP